MIFKDVDKAKEQVDKIASRNKKIEIKESRGPRTNDQNRYFHGVVCKVYAVEFGYTVEEAKQIFKQVFRDQFVYEKNGYEFVKGTSDMDTKEMTTLIDYIRAWSSRQGCYIPSPDDVTDELIFQLENEYDKMVS